MKVQFNFLEVCAIGRQRSNMLVKQHAEFCSSDRYESILKLKPYCYIVQN